MENGNGITAPEQHKTAIITHHDAGIRYQHNLVLQHGRRGGNGEERTECRVREGEEAEFAIFVSYDVMSCMRNMRIEERKEKVGRWGDLNLYRSGG